MPRKEMDGIEIADFLESQQTGVLSMGKDDDGYGVPLSFAYDPASSDVYFRLGYTPHSRKRAFVDASDRVSFVVYDDTDEGWKSVVVEGRLEELADGSLDAAVEESVRNLQIPYFEVHERPASETALTVARLRSESLTGVVEGSK